MESPDLGSSPAPPPHQLALEAKSRLEARAKELAGQSKAVMALATAFQPLTSPRGFADLTKVPATLEAIAKKIEATPMAAESGLALLAIVRQGFDDWRQQQRDSLARELQQACAARGLTFRVVSREEPVEIRLPPFSIVLDRERGQAQVRFAQLPVAQCATDAHAILAAWERAQNELNADFDLRTFFEATRRAWACARAAQTDSENERVEILDFLPYLALQFQSPAFRVEPSSKNFRGYSRARFAWDVARCRRDGGLAQNGWRLNLGVATGTSASKKNRVIWFEDENGEGEYKLTVFFTRTELQP